MTFGRPAATALSYCARDSSIRTAAIATSRFSLATRCSNAVKIGSLNSVHQFGSIGSSTATLTGALGLPPPNQEPGPLQPGEVKFGPRVVQPTKTSSAQKLQKGFRGLACTTKPHRASVDGHNERCS